MPPKLKMATMWFLAFAAASALAILLFTNTLVLPFHDHARNVVGVNSHGQSINAAGNTVTIWQRKSFAEYAVTALLGFAALFSCWKLVGVFVAQRWLRAVVMLVSISVVIIAAYVVGFILLWDF